MSVEKFLSFWSHYNVYIIEGLLASVILLSLLLAFRAFFGNKEGPEAQAGQGSVDASQLEKTLQKILENQAANGAGAASAGAAPVSAEVTASEPSPESVAAAADGRPQGASSEATQVEIEVLKKSLSDSKKEIANLQAKVKATEAAAPAGDTAAPSATTSQDVSEFMDRIRDLEARLAEYEIISEDIADLSKYREENNGLKKELESLKSAAGTPPTTTVAASAPAPEPTVTVAAATETPAPNTTVAGEKKTDEPSVTVAVAPASGPTDTTVVSTETAPVDLIDDELMKEFAAAVEGQKGAALNSAAEKAGDGKVAVNPAPDETSALMNDFESFVNKKS